MSNTREPGYYWVKLNSEWIMGRFFGDDVWLLFMTKMAAFDSDFEAIDETIILNPDEKRLLPPQE